jgi:beta-carotene ketolase (CrtO type)
MEFMRKSTEERYDIVIIGAGPNGVALAAYLAKCGLSVCVLEERSEAGGACEQTEPIAGVRINPHAVVMYASAAPGLEQLELWKYGLRMSWEPTWAFTPIIKTVMTTEGAVPFSDKDGLGWAKITGMLGSPTFTKDLLRATFWCPPHPPEVEVTAENTPFMQVYKERAPEVWTEELLQMTMFDLMDEYCETEPFKVLQAFAAWYSGAAGHFEGMAIPAMGADIAVTLYGASAPRGAMHDYFHAVLRCALAHGAVVRTCCPVEEIIIRNGRAAGVRLRDNAAWGEKTIWADKAVVSAVDVRQTFNKLIGPQHVDRGLLQKVNDISLKGGSIYVSHFLTRELLRFRPKFKEWGHLTGGFYPCDSREIYYDHVADVDGRKGDPTMPAQRVFWMAVPAARFPSTDPQCTIPNRHLISPFYVLVPPPEYHVDGPDAINKYKEKWNAYMREAFSAVVENLNSDNLIAHWANTPYESEFRNTGLIGGTWCGTRHCGDQWAETRPIPELARYRTPIDGLYLCNQTACHPGALFLMAIPYNLMHIMIEDGLVEPGDWWYPSPWYIPQQGKKSAIPGK